MTIVESTSVWAAVIGQPQAVRRLTQAASNPVHAYLFVGPPGSTKDEASRGFAALLMAGADDASNRDARLALAGNHPDVRGSLPSKLPTSFAMPRWHPSRALAR